MGNMIKHSGCGGPKQKCSLTLGTAFNFIIALKTGVRKGIIKD